MECPYCGAELTHIDSFGTLDYIRGRDDKGKRGDIYQCPNKDEFLHEDEANAYLKSWEQTLVTIGVDNWWELTCENERGNAFYYVYEGKCDIHEGYPC